MDLRKRLSKAEKALLKIDDLYNDDTDASRIVKEYFNSIPLGGQIMPKIADVGKHDEITATILEGVFITYTEKEYGYTRGGLPQECVKKMMEILIKRGYEPQIKTWNILKDGRNC